MIGGIDNEATAERIEAIARDNDKFRAALAFGGVAADVPGQVLVTPGVSEMRPEFLALLHLTVAGFSDFTEENDPWGDHSFGAVEVCGTRIFWKIDLYDEHYRFGASIPESPEKPAAS